MTLKRWRYTPNGRRISLLFGKRRMRIRTYGVVRGMVETPPYSIFNQIEFGIKNQEMLLIAKIKSSSQGGVFAS